jgi:acetoin utilization deacetylase AcuC-like enzyme
MPALFFDPLFLAHETGAGHPERPDRLMALIEALEASTRYPPEGPRECRPADFEVLCRVHDPAYVQLVEQLCQSGGGMLDADTTVSTASCAAAFAAAGAVVSATEGVMKGEFSSAFCAVRPPGHHALSSRGMGFCLFNNVAVAAAHARTQLGVDNVLIIDWDVHHGNGTQAIFDADPSVRYLSTHRFPHYPGTGASGDCGKGAAVGTKLNVPLEAGTGHEEFLGAFGAALNAMATFSPPDIVFISAGFDAARGDLLGGLDLVPQTFADATAAVRAFTKNAGHERIVSVLEGGYNLDQLAACGRAHFEALP